MDNSELQSKLMDYIYGEMEPEERQEFEQQLHEQPELQNEMEEMRSTKNLFGEDTSEISPKKLMLIDTGPKQKSSGASKLFYLKTAAAIAATILLALFALSYANLQISTNESGMVISFGTATAQPEPPPQTEDFVTEEEFYALMNELQDQNNQVMATALAQTRQQHQQQMENVIETLTAYYDQRRQQDLVLVSEGLAQLEEETYYKFLQTEQTIEDLIFALNVQQTSE